MAKKIWSRYIEPGSEFEVNSIPANTANAIKAKLDEPSEDLFDELQGDVYALMLFDFFPRFW